MLKTLKRDAFTAKWEELRTRAAVPCAVALVLSVLAGLVFRQPAAGMIMAGGALSVGFGSFQTLGRSQTAPMLIATVGISLSALAGSILAQTPAGTVVMALVAGLLYGLMTALGPGASWIGLQCAIAAIIAGGYPSGGGPAIQRALLIFAGGVLQTLVVIASRRLHAPFISPAKEDTYTGAAAALRLVRENLRWSSDAFRFGLHLAITLTAASLAANLFAISNGYWVPMTVLLVLKPDVHQTFGRGVARVLGTLFGAGVATLLASLLHPSPLALAGFIALFAWLCYSLVNVNYSLFSACVTAYIAFLLAFAGRPTKEIALHRIANTALGGGLALVAYGPGVIRERLASRSAADPAETGQPE